MDDLTQNLALALGASWASGINLYAAILVLGLMGASGAVELPAGLAILSDPLVLLAAGAMYLALFFLFLIWLLPKVWHGLQRVWTALRKHFGGDRATPSPVVATLRAAGGAAVDGRPPAAPPEV